MRHSGQSDVNGSEFAVANLHNGIDIYNIPSLNLVKSFLFSIKVNALYKVCLATNGWVVAGGENGCARLYDIRRGELLQMIRHSDGKCALCLSKVLTSSRIFQILKMTLCNSSR